MNQLNSDWQNAIGINIGLLVAGFAGGVVSTYFATNLTRTQAVGSIVCSILTAAYATPAAIAYFGIQQEPYKFGTAFLIGLFTMSLIPAIKALGAKYIQKKVQGLENEHTPSNNSGVSKP
jgi:hypothetical protein